MAGGESWGIREAGESGTHDGDDAAGSGAGPGEGGASESQPFSTLDSRESKVDSSHCSVLQTACGLRFALALKCKDDWYGVLNVVYLPASSEKDLQVASCNIAMQHCRYLHASCLVSHLS